MTRTAAVIAAGLVSMFFVGPSQAADLRPPPRMFTKARPAPPPSPAPAPVWQGIYGGFNAGYGWGKSTVSSSAGADGTAKPDGALAGVQLGYNNQIGGFVFGIEGDLAYSWMKDTNTSTACSNCEVRNHYLATFRGRLGYTMGNWLPYVTGGAAVGDIQVSTPAGGSQAINKLGWTVGGGVEYGFSASRWSVKVEYLYSDLGAVTCDASHCGVATSADLKTNVVRGGINYHF